MFVRISPEDRSPLDFEVDIEFSLPGPSPEEERAVRETIFKETG